MTPKPPSLSIGSAAKDMLARWSRLPEFSGHVPSISWMGDESGVHWDWAVGAYARDSVQAEHIVECEGIEFVIDRDLWKRLDGMHLDHDGTEFTVRRKIVES
jgi:hypothetical protein